MDLLTVLFIILFTFSVITLFLIAPGRSTLEQQKGLINHNFAHRGLHTKDKRVPENSLAAFREAVKAGYGIELDLRLTKDEQVIVFHDDTLKRVCGINKRVDSFTYTELKQYKLHKTTEHIPLFSDVLCMVNGKVPLLIELKNSRKNPLLCKKTLALLKSYQGNYCIESFHPLIVGWFRKHEPDILRGQLSEPLKEFKKALPFWQALGLSRLLLNFYSRPHFIAYRKGKTPLYVKLCTLLGAKSFVWTIRPEDNHRKQELTHDGVIFEYYLPKPVYEKPEGFTSPR